MRDLNYLRKTFQRSLSDKQWITKPEELQVYKYHQLDVAESVGLKIPKTLTTNLKSELKNFILENKRVITKSISDPTSFYSYVEGSPQVSMMRTIEVDSEVLKNVKDTFFPSLFQELINKKIELRVFYLDRKFYSMAIFSQLDEQTTIDFRNYNDETPNRTVPFKLPLEIKEKLQKFIDHFNFTTGSFDLIYTDKNEFVFLEINQVGQFGMTSFPTNYDLEKILAKHLITIDEREQHKI